MKVTDADLGADAEAILALNNGAVPAVNALDAADLAHLAAMGAVRVVKAGGILGFIITMDARQPYDSLNYRWFAERYPDFFYIDRVVVDGAARGMGVGRLLYEDTIARAAAGGHPRVASEVNVDPPNPQSMAFHARLGFEPVAERLNEREGKTVAMMVRGA